MSAQTLSSIDALLTNLESCNLCYWLQGIFSLEVKSTDQDPIMLKLFTSNFPPDQLTSGLVEKKRTKRSCITNVDRELKVKKKSVRFSPEHDNIHQYDLPDEAGESDLFYGMVEFRAMVSARNRAVTNIREKYIALLASGVINDTVLLHTYTLNGIENLIILRIAEMAVSCQERSLCAVFDEQARQVASGKFDPDKLAGVSQLRSTWAVKRAEQIGRQQASQRL